MSGNGQSEQKKAPPSTAELYRGLLQEGQAAQALELAITETERAKLRLQEQRSISLTPDGRFQVRTLDALLQLGRMFADSGLVPRWLQGNAAGCAVGVQFALRTGVDPMLVLQSMYLVHGKMGIEAKVFIAMLAASPRIKGRVWFTFEGEGRNRSCTAHAIDAETEKEHTMTVTWSMVEKEGWDKKDGSKWMTIPDLMFQYRSAAWLARTSFPEVVLGVYASDELEDAFDGAVSSSHAEVDLTAILQSPAVPPAMETTARFQPTGRPGCGDTAQPKLVTTKDPLPNVTVTEPEVEMEPETEPDVDTRCKVRPPQSLSPTVRPAGDDDAILARFRSTMARFKTASVRQQMLQKALTTAPMHLHGPLREIAASFT